MVSGAQIGRENTRYNYMQYNVLRMMNVTWNQIHIHEFHPKSLSNGKSSASLAHADWANAADLPAFLKSGYREVSLHFLKCLGQTLTVW